MTKFRGYSVRVIRTTYLESEVYEGSYHGAPSTDTDVRDYDGMHALDMVRICRDYGLSFKATGMEWAANPDGSQTVDYATGEMEEVTFHFGDDVPWRLQVAVMEVVG